ncbi:predicted protein [Naegleria gruberi]|uniref:Predicted protein n=1 Tax=Naegleria gruberi TaxID=5762 RepID=D2UYT7_NAEGR|nr:uncharacterized protein NAEGRDRAFT_61584 [Naegleria gruberi]EFC50843.1 predicted protein [Naegleria gruberi]|eukprot:XP_002683587.1 predicted protein [Naegleria gruberi strain NEG-M]
MQFNSSSGGSNVTTIENNIQSCLSLSREIIEHTLGPMGMDISIFESNNNHKVMDSSSQYLPYMENQSLQERDSMSISEEGNNEMMKSNNFIITNDGSTIIKYLNIEHPSCQLLSRASLLQDRLIGDGTSSVVILTCELLNQALNLIKNRNLHPSLIVRGFQLAVLKSKLYLNSYAVNSNEKDIESLIRTCMQSKIISQYEEYFVNLIRNVHNHKLNLRVIYPNKNFKLFYFNEIGNDMSTTCQYSGYKFTNLKHFNVNQFNMKNVKILMCKAEELNGNFVSKIFRVSQSNLENEYKKLTELCDYLINELNINVIFNVGIGIHKIVQEYLKHKNVLCVGFVDFKSAEVLSIIGNSIISSGYNNCGYLDEINLTSVDNGNYHLEILSNSQNHAKYIWNTIKISSPNSEISNEIQRSIQDCMGILNHTEQVCPGGGATFMDISKYIRTLNYPNQLQFILEAFSNALEVIPKVLSTNMGYDASIVLSKLRSIKNEQYFGVSMDEQVSNQLKSGVIEPCHLIVSIMDRALEFSEMILRIDENIYIKPFHSNVKM